MQTMLIVGAVSLIWVAFGYSWAFDDSYKTSGSPLFFIIGGWGKAFLHGVTADTMMPTGIPELTFVMFQCMFALITPALILGAFAERIKFKGYMVFTLLWVIIAYLPMAHWVWGGGFLQEMGAIDFAGGTVVHINAGVSALVMALMIGKREDYRVGHPITPHNIMFVVLGTSFLWLGGCGINGGSGRGAAGGEVAGVVGMTSAAGSVDLLGAFGIGVITPIVCFIMVAAVKPYFKYDDALDAFGVHGVGGIIGSILTGVFATQYITGEGGVEGALYGDWHQLWVQLVATGVSIVFALVVTTILFLVVDKTIGIRVDKRVEEEGLDIYEHGESAYN